MTDKEVGDWIKGIRFASRDGKETYVMLTDPVVQMIVAGLRTVYKRSLMH